MSSYDIPLSFSKLAQKLVEHGLVCRDAAEQSLIEQRLKSVSYYRLEEYTWPYRKVKRSNPATRLSTFKSGITIHLVWNTYVFDRRLRILLLDAVERFEVALKNHITQVLVEAAGHNIPQTDLQLLPKFAYTDNNGISRLDKWLKKANAAYAERKDARIEHCRTVHQTTDVKDLPLWILMEILTYGAVRKLYDAMDEPLQRKVASQMGVEHAVLDSSIALLHHVRNCCAHHGRVWNRKWSQQSRHQKLPLPYFSAKPAAPEWYSRFKNNEWETPHSPGGLLSMRPSDTAFVFLLCGYWLGRIAQSSSWKKRVENTVQPNGTVLQLALSAGFADGWNKHPLWKV